MAVALISALFVAGCGSSSVRRENIYSSKNRNMLQLGGMVLPNDSGNRVSMEVVIFKEPTADDKIEPAPVMLIFSGGKSNFKLAECSTAELLADGQSLPIQDCKYQKSETAREANLSNYRTTNRSSEECLVLWLGLNEFRSFVGAMKAESIICDQSFTLQSWQSEEIKQLLASAEL
ncbi:MAG: hypothetical protein JXA30_01020 [Deltaproteobacteria bacterium]|nr:hypothetical protein [Deltaproteobacteria bacterium]